MDHLSHPVVSSLVFFPRKFVALAYYVIDGFVSITTKPTYAILLRLIYSCFDIIGSYAGLSLEVSFSYPHPGFVVWDVVY